MPYVQAVAVPQEGWLEGRCHCLLSEPVGFYTYTNACSHSHAASCQPIHPNMSLLPVSCHSQIWSRPIDNARRQPAQEDLRLMPPSGRITHSCLQALLAACILARNQCADAHAHLNADGRVCCSLPSQNPHYQQTVRDASWDTHVESKQPHEDLRSTAAPVKHLVDIMAVDAFWQPDVLGDHELP